MIQIRTKRLAKLFCLGTCIALGLGCDKTEAPVTAPPVESPKASRTIAAPTPVIAHSLWKLYRPQRGAYRIQMPGIPSESFSPVQTAEGMRGEQFALTQVSEQLSFGAMYSDYPQGLAARLGTAGILDEARESLLSKSKGSLVSDKEVTQGELVGRELVLSAPTGQESIMRLVARHFVVKGRLFRLLALSVEVDAKLDEQHFFDSFKADSAAIVEQQTPTLSPFTSEEAGFRILSGHEEPTRSNAKIALAKGEPQPLSSFTFPTIGLDQVKLMVSWSDMEHAPEDVAAIKASFDQGRDRVLATLSGASLKRERDITLGKHPGREVLLEAKTKGLAVQIVARFYLVGARWYHVQALYFGASDALAWKLVESFEFVPIKHVKPPMPQMPQMPDMHGAPKPGKGHHHH